MNEFAGIQNEYLLIRSRCFLNTRDLLDKDSLTRAVVKALPRANSRGKLSLLLKKTNHQLTCFVSHYTKRDFSFRV